MSKQSDLVTVARDAGASGYVNVTGDTMTGRLVVNDTINADTSYPFAIQNGSQEPWYLRSLTTSNTFAVHRNGLGDVIRCDSSGRVTMPYQPAFQAYGVAGTTFQSSSVRVYPSTRFNIGSHYNTSNGRFTAPVAGVYLFGWTHIGNTTNTVYRYRLRKNGSNVGDVHLRLDTSASGGEYGTNGVYTFPLQLAATDYVEIFYQSDSNIADYPEIAISTEDYSMFWGYLLG